MEEFYISVFEYWTLPPPRPPPRDLDRFSFYEALHQDPCNDSNPWVLTGHQRVTNGSPMGLKWVPNGSPEGQMPRPTTIGIDRKPTHLKSKIQLRCCSILDYSIINWIDELWLGLERFRPDVLRDARDTLTASWNLTEAIHIWKLHPKP